MNLKHLDLDRLINNDLELFELSEDIIYMDEISEVERISILFELYNQIPSYTVIARILSIETLDEKDNNIKNFLWNEFYNYLSFGDDFHAKNILYTLDVDYFEDERFVYDVWNYFMSKELNDTFLKRVLPVTGSVPYHLKSELYSKLITNKENHIYIFKSLYESKFGGFPLINQIDNVEAKKVLCNLDLSAYFKQNNDYNKLWNALNI